MIGIFNGRGIADTARVHAQIDVDFRDHVHEFNNGHNLNALAVFLCLSLHANTDGWAWPTRDLLKKETGLSTDSAISNAIKHLRETKIEGVPILMHFRLRDKENKRWDRSLYLIFPSLPHGAPPEDLTEGCDVFVVVNGEPHPLDPPPIDPGVGQPGIGHPDVDDQGYKKNHHKEEPLEEEPSEASQPEKDHQDTDLKGEALLDAFGLGMQSANERDNGRSPDPGGPGPWRLWGENSSVVGPRFGIDKRHVQRVGYLLETEYGLAPPWGNKSRVKHWVNGCAELYQVADGDLNAIKEAGDKLRADGLTISRPQSLYNTVSSLVAERRSKGGDYVMEVGT